MRYVVEMGMGMARWQAGGCGPSLPCSCWLICFFFSPDFFVMIDLGSVCVFGKCFISSKGKAKGYGRKADLGNWGISHLLFFSSWGGTNRVFLLSFSVSIDFFSRIEILLKRWRRKWERKGSKKASEYEYV